MSAAMNGAINVSIPDGWYPEFAKHKTNSFVIPASNPIVQNICRMNRMPAVYMICQNEIIPMYLMTLMPG